MGEPSVVPLAALDAHGAFTRASLPELLRAAEDVTIAAAQLRLLVQRIRVRGGDPTVAVDLVALATARLQGVEQELLAAARALEGRL